MTTIEERAEDLARVIQGESMSVARRWAKAALREALLEAAGICREVGLRWNQAEREFVSDDDARRRCSDRAIVAHELGTRIRALAGGEETKPGVVFNFGPQPCTRCGEPVIGGNLHTMCVQKPAPQPLTEERVTEIVLLSTDVRRMIRSEVKAALSSLTIRSKEP